MVGVGSFPLMRFSAAETFLPLRISKFRTPLLCRFSCTAKRPLKSPGTSPATTAILPCHTGGAESLTNAFAFRPPLLRSYHATRVEQRRETGQALFGKRIQRLREAMGLSQEGLARRAGVGRLMVARLEKGKLSPRHETLAALS